MVWNNFVIIISAGLSIIQLAINLPFPGWDIIHSVSMIENDLINGQHILFNRTPLVLLNKKVLYIGNETKVFAL